MNKKALHGDVDEPLLLECSLYFKHDPPDQGGACFLLCYHTLACAGLAFAQADAARHLVFGRVITEDALDGIAHALELAS